MLFRLRGRSRLGIGFRFCFRRRWGSITIFLRLFFRWCVHHLSYLITLTLCKSGFYQAVFLVRRHHEQALAATPRLPQFSDLALFFGVFLEMVTLVFDDQVTAVRKPTDEIGVEASG